MDITLISGKKGLSNIVSWVHMIETKEATPFLEGGEIAFSTGIGLNNSLSIFDLVENIWFHKASGIILNLGPFLEDIPQEIIDFGNEHDFPIFTVPWKTHIAEIMRIFCYAITKSEQANLEIAAAFKNAIFLPQHSELYLIPLSSHHFQANWKYYVCIVKVSDSKHETISTHLLESLILNIEFFLQHRHYERYAIFGHDGQIVIALANYSETDLDDFIAVTSTYIKSILSQEQQFHMSVGKCTKSIRCLYKSYRQALAIQHLHEKNKINESMITYSKMGVYKLLMGIEDKDILVEYYETTILPLEEYDKNNDSDLLGVLRTYLYHNGSVQETADELFVHRNTINYKLNRAAEIMNVNLSKLEVRLQLLLGLMLQDML